MSHIEIEKIIKELKNINVIKDKKLLIEIHEKLVTINMENFDLDLLLDKFINEKEVINFFLLLLRTYVELTILNNIKNETDSEKNIENEKNQTSETTNEKN